MSHMLTVEKQIKGVPSSPLNLLTLQNATSCCFYENDQLMVSLDSGQVRCFDSSNDFSQSQLLNILYEEAVGTVIPLRH
jgi:hypothetical protein